MFGWFAALSTLARIGVITGATVATVGTASVVSNNNPEPTKSIGTTQTTSQKPKVETKDETTTEDIPYTTQTVDDSTLDSGKTVVRVEGVNGTKTKYYKVTYTDGKKGLSEFVREEITKQPVAKVIANGTKVVQANCVAGYSPCIAPGSDVDCAGGTGDGPRYVSGPITVTGSDPYRLDADHNGVGCE